MPNSKLFEETREALEAIPDKEYAEMQIAWYKEQLKYWQNELKELEKKD